MLVLDDVVDLALIFGLYVDTIYYKHTDEFSASRDWCVGAVNSLDDKTACRMLESC